MIKESKWIMGIVLSLLVLGIKSQVMAQSDTNYVKDYPQKISLNAFTGIDGFLLTKGSEDFSPNYPLLLGVGITIKNTLVNIHYSQGIIPLKSKEWGKSKVFDFQIHKFTKDLMIDVYLQRYKGFHREVDDPKNIEIFPNLNFFQVGGELHYLFGDGKLSLQAAFDGLKIQARSTGSFTLGGSVNYTQLSPGNAFELENDKSEVNNFQLGVDAGYAYSWVASPHWLLAGIVTGGLNLGNEPHEIKSGNLKVYPTALGRGSVAFNEKTWSLSMVILVQNKIVYAVNKDYVTATVYDLRLTYIKRLDRLFGKKKVQRPDENKAGF